MSSVERERDLSTLKLTEAQFEGAVKVNYFNKREIFFAGMFLG